MTTDSGHGTHQTGGEATEVMRVLREVQCEPALANALAKLLFLDRDHELKPKHAGRSDAETVGDS